ncbi:DUF6316 family protein [Aliikangiella sp. IMCC44653]
MKAYRETDLRTSNKHNRSHRIVSNKEGIFYKTRENHLVGPFSTLSKAKFDLNIFIEVATLEQQLEQDYSLQVAWG